MANTLAVEHSAVNTLVDIQNNFQDNGLDIILEAEHTRDSILVVM